MYELVDRPNKQICSAEYYIEGKFEKHNNNYGYINDDTDRNTPQAFSHFRYQNTPTPPDLVETHRRSRSKLRGDSLSTEIVQDLMIDHFV